MLFHLLGPAYPSAISKADRPVKSCLPVDFLSSSSSDAVSVGMLRQLGLAEAVGHQSELLVLWT